MCDLAAAFPARENLANMSPSSEPICHSGNLSAEHTAIDFDSPCPWLQNYDAFEFFSRSDFALFRVVLPTVVFGVVWVRVFIFVFRNYDFKFLI